MIVADSGPLNFLIRLGRADVLPILFDEVLLPCEVRWEMTRQSTPLQVRRWVDHPPAWLQVSDPTQELTSKRGLHIGELVAIHHALERSATLLIDDRRARIEAKRLGLAVSGTLAVLYEAGLHGLLDFEADLHGLLKTEFRISRSVTQQFLERWRNR